MTIRAYCIHGHFYQPPREDPLTGVIPSERGAAPYNNWNERIHAECYRPNADLGNFQQISFNVGPTLFSWIRAFDPDTAHKIVAQDRLNVERYGVGNAIAQAYNHTILPLGSYRDKVTQVYWGIADFTHHFGRAPQGLWLPETAVDLETLDVLERHNIKFTILAPWQAESEDIDPTEPYRVALPGGREMTVFFYQRELSTRVSFDPASTVDADLFAKQALQKTFHPEKEDQLLVVASDGELYGHHQRLRELFLARLVDGAGSQIGLQPTYPALWLKTHPPQRRTLIRERTSWSCHHGVMRWMGACACTPGDASWKAQLRYAFERLASELDHLYQEVTQPHIADPWRLRDRYIHVMLGEITIDELVSEMAGAVLSKEQVRRIHLMLEAQRERQRMFTSCGWFFEDFDRIEPRNVVAYAAQAVHLARLATGEDLEACCAGDLSRVVSPRTGLCASDLFEHHLQRTQWVHSVKVGYAD